MYSCWMGSDWQVVAQCSNHVSILQGSAPSVVHRRCSEHIGHDRHCAEPMVPETEPATVDDWNHQQRNIKFYLFAHTVTWFIWWTYDFIFIKNSTSYYNMIEVLDVFERFIHICFLWQIKIKFIKYTRNNITSIAHIH